MKPQTNPLIPIIITIALTLATAHACAIGIKRQAYADYQQCLSWQASGYEVQCDKDEYIEAAAK